MADPPRKATYDDILALPAHINGQIIDGILHTQARPAPQHAQVTSTLGEELGRPFKRGKGGPGGWLILDEPEVHLGADVVVPDLGGWRRTTLPELPVDRAYFQVAPDWVCEVLSPSTRRLDRGEKLRVYAEHKVAHVWFVEPEAQTLEVLTLDGATYRVTMVYAADAKVRAAPFEAFELDLALLWLR